MKNAEVIQVGFMAMRKPNGDFLEAKPIYMRATPKMVAKEKKMLISFNDYLIPYIQNYIDTQKKLKHKLEGQTK
ncbi:MAG: hypothetical protein RR454_00340 [Clostridia bacterium]